MRHHELSLETFIRSLGTDYLKRYCERRKLTLRTALGAGNVGAMQRFLEAPENAEVSSGILEDFKRINDMSGSEMPILVRACQTYGIAVDTDEPAAQISMRVFLDHEEAFELAWSRHLLSVSSSPVTVYPVPTKGLTLTPKQIQIFQKGVQTWFHSLARGKQCEVKVFSDRSQAVFLVRHGHYLRTVSRWEGDAISYLAVRPAVEDILVYDASSSELQVRAGLAKDRETYLRLFCSEIAGDSRIADSAMKGEIFTLAPLQDGRFNYLGKGQITRVELVKLRMVLRGATNPEIELKSADVLEAFKHDMGRLSIKSGTITLARFRFHLLHSGKKQTTATIEIQPPSRTDLTESKHADLIEKYLRDQGVKLR